MNMKNILAKIQSRKFLTCVAGIIMGICMVFGLDEGTINTIAGAVTAVVSIATYIYTEGKIDAAAVDKIKDVSEQVKDVIDAVEQIEE